jgi:hypothetical protein
MEYIVCGPLTQPILSKLNNLQDSRSMEAIHSIWVKEQTTNGSECILILLLLKIGGSKIMQKLAKYLFRLLLLVDLEIFSLFLVINLMM